MAEVLLIDRDLKSRVLFQDLLSLEGYAVYCHPRIELARTGLDSPTRENIQLIQVETGFSDQGFRFSFDKLNALFERKIPIVAVTANAMLGVERKMLDYGFSGYLTKPVDIQVYLAFIRRFSGTRDAGPISDF